MQRAFLYERRILGDEKQQQKQTRFPYASAHNLIFHIRYYYKWIQEQIKRSDRNVSDKFENRFFILKTNKAAWFEFSSKFFMRLSSQLISKQTNMYPVFLFFFTVSRSVFLFYCAISRMVYSGATLFVNTCLQESDIQFSSWYGSKCAQK